MVHTQICFTGEKDYANLSLDTGFASVTDSGQASLFPIEVSRGLLGEDTENLCG